MAKASKTDDAKIVNRVLAGEVDAYRELVERYQYALYSCAYQLLGSAEAAEEAAQEAFVQAFAKLANLREPRYYFSWAWRICSTVALKAREKSRRNVLGLDGHDVASGVMLTSVELEERNRGLVEALSELPEEQREVLTLRFWEGMNYDDMSSLLGVSHDALYQRASRGIKELKERLGAEFLIDG